MVTLLERPLARTRAEKAGLKVVWDRILGRNGTAIPLRELYESKDVWDFVTTFNSVLFLRRDGPLVATRDLPPYLWTRLRQAAAPALTIPHQLTGPAIDWQFHDPEFQPVMEIYQGRRQNYEYDGAPQPPGVEQVWGKQSGSWAWDALARGHKLGFIASSDHFSTHMSYAAVYASELTPAGIHLVLRNGEVLFRRDFTGS